MLTAHRVLQPTFVEADEIDFRPLPDESASGGQADPALPTGDEGDLSPAAASHRSSARELLRSPMGAGRVVDRSRAARADGYACSQQQPSTSVALLGSGERRHCWANSN